MMHMVKTLMGILTTLMTPRIQQRFLVQQAIGIPCVVDGIIVVVLRQESPGVLPSRAQEICLQLAKGVGGTDLDTAPPP